jgi:hypothetical protein
MTSLHCEPPASAVLLRQRFDRLLYAYRIEVATQRQANNVTVSLQRAVSHKSVSSAEFFSFLLRYPAPADSRRGCFAGLRIRPLFLTGSRFFGQTPRSANAVPCRAAVGGFHA